MLHKSHRSKKTLKYRIKGNCVFTKFSVNHEKLTKNINNVMKKYIAILTSLIFVSISSAKAESVIGITGAYHMLDASGTETIRTSGEKNNGTHSEDVLVPEIFIEGGGSDFIVGLSYIPTRDVGNKSRTDSGDQSAGTYTAKAELDNVVQVYGDYTFTSVPQGDVYFKLGIQHATLKTLESLNSGSTYPDADLFGYTLGLGLKGDLPYGDGLIFKADLTYTDFESYSAGATDGNGNKINADLEDVALKFSIGKKF